MLQELSFSVLQSAKYQFTVFEKKFYSTIHVVATVRL